MRHSSLVVISLQWRILRLTGSTDFAGVTGEPKRKYPCMFCGKLFLRRGHASQHERKHTGNLPYSCEICNKKFINKSHYDYHMTRSLEHQTNLRNTGGCDGGGGGDDYGEEEVVKVLVDKAFCLLPSFPYMDHPASSSSGPYPAISAPQQVGYGCQVCGQIIQRRDNYRRHLRLHSGLLPFQCHLCPRRFNTRYHLQYHLKCSKVHAAASDSEQVDA
ncbi:Zinc finger protein 888-like 2 [Homarus americanus]|uniref:Zinc finger protein 888-like 2 n=1 Tax=Homarus americanus TaxID=6706 RepID=A0A8J5K5P4_HOMAM|nr:Zinc finger protein 888-like 2 [Homarus americanus]